ncbi:RNA 3'-terminal phosphate cyclase [Cylindrobasidium torrendii FP15055 ss-10]|uniref:RNA 3'-terminal phosphate cyclase n=1 Tax=Cylindrobasidium torrendii FP15055 ss-10 TaxID=1314674 RepID=A0A0D7BBU4_9AGAR|nr:RNA 3'-terminal phosphate cyclase [Cylindrobasidium torrendii FP15055 ss-10]
MTPILIDGSVLEGGGQILRNAIAYSALLSKPVKIHNIRASRRPPGLKNQHRTGLELAARIASAELKGATNGSSEIEFNPGRLQLPGHFTGDAITAGSTTLLLQIALPLLLLSKTSGSSTLTLKGGTNASNAPQIDYTQNVFLPFARKHFGLEATLEIKRRGYFPKGGGEVFVEVHPSATPLKACNVSERGDVVAVKGIAHVAGIPAHLAKSMADSAAEALRASLGDTLAIDIQNTREKNNNTAGAGSGIVLWAEVNGVGAIGGSALGSKGKSPAAVGKEAAEELLKGLESGGCVDEYMQDQIIILMALASGLSEVRCGKGALELHTKTAIWVAEQMTDAKFEVDELPTHTLVRCTGMGHA